MAFTAETIAQDNLCVIWVDDMIDVFTWRNAFGIPIQTPNLDRLLNAGVRFSNTYATVPLCAPCRAELATGLSPFRTWLVDLNRFWRNVRTHTLHDPVQHKAREVGNHFLTGAHPSFTLYT